MTDLGGLSARVGLNTAGLRAGRISAESELLKVEGALLKTERAGVRMSSSLGKAGKLAGAVVGFELLKKAAEGIKGATEYAIDLEATMGRVDNVFKDAAEQVVKFADTSDRTLGRTKEAALQTTVRFGTLGTQFGETADQAAASSIALTKLASDLAASKGTTPEQATQALATALVGRGRALRLYGIDVSAATVKNEALKEGLIRTNRDAMTPAITYQAAYNAIMKQSTNVQGYFARNVDNTQEKLAIAKATLTDASEELGLAFAPAAKTVADILSKDVAPTLKVVGEGFGYLGDHKVARDIVLMGGAVGLLAVAVSKIGRALAESREFFAETLGRTVEQTTAIKAEGAAAEVTAGQLLALRDAEVAASGVPVGDGAAIAGAETAAAGGAGAATRKTPILGGGVGGVLAVGGIVAVQETLDRRALDKRLADQVAAGKGASRADLLKQAAALGVSPGAKPGQFITDPKADADARAAGIKLLDEAAKAPTRSTAPLLRLSPVQAAGANLAAAAKVLANARATAGDAKTQQAEAGIVGGALGGAFDELPKMTKGDPVKAAEALTAANDRLAKAEARVAAVRKGSGGPSRASLLSAEAAVLSAEDTLRKHKGDTTVQTLHLQAAEQRLATLRAGGKVNATQLTTAEDALTTARKKADKAAKDAAKAGGSTSLSVKDVLSRLGGQLGRSKGLADASETLIKDGISKPVLEQLDMLEKTAPGTLERVAKEMTPKFARALNAEESAVEAAQRRFLTAPLQAAVVAAKAANTKAVQELAAAQRAAYVQALRGGTDPVIALPGVTPGGPGNDPLAPLFNGRHGSQTTVYSMPNATVVANNPAQLAKALQQKQRLGALSGSGTGHGV